MFWKVVLSWLSFHITHAAYNTSQERLLSAWCELHSVGVAFSGGEFFPCPNKSYDVLRGVGSLKGVTLKVGIIQGGDFGYDCSSDVENGRVIPKDSYGLYLLTILQEILQFDTEFLSSTSWGFYEESTNSWKGLTGLLAYNETDLTACHWSATDVLADIAEYLFSTLETSEAFIYIPQNLPLTEDAFVEAFSRKLWVFFLLSIFLLIVSFWFSTYMHSRVRPDHEQWKWDEVVLWAVAAISQQNYSRHPRGSSCRTMFLIGYLITYLFYTGFAAGITSLLALQSDQNRLTFRDVAVMKLQLLFHRDEFYRDFFEMPRMAHIDNQRPEGESLKHIFEKLQQANYVGLGATATLLNYLRKEEDQKKRLHYSIVPVADSDRRKAFLVRRGFLHKRLFDYWLLRLREIGLLDHGTKRYIKPEGVAHFQAAIWFSAGLGNVFSAFAFLGIGWILSFFVLLVEVLRKKKRKY